MDGFLLYHHHCALNGARAMIGTNSVLISFGVLVARALAVASLGRIEGPFGIATLVAELAGAVVVAGALVDGVGAAGVVEFGAAGAVSLQATIPYMRPANMLLAYDLVPGLFIILRILELLLCLRDAVEVLLLRSAEWVDLRGITRLVNNLRTARRITLG